ncbi:MAG TPA: GAF domain-containing protein [Thermoanaerobaculia bacterium]|nr:GAF domain-containing protein [Thermoanaerobaculia bacterium]
MSEARVTNLEALVRELSQKSRALSTDLAEQSERLARRARELEQDLDAAQTLLSREAASGNGHADAAPGGNGNGNGASRPAADLERENRDFARRCVQLEEHSANLANLYAATYQLHATLDPDAVVGCIVEITVNLIGGAEFALYLLEDGKSDFALRVREGELPPEITHLPEPVYPLEQAAVVEKRTLFAVEEQEGPICCVPLLHEDRLIGLLSIYALLSHKAAFTPLDRELLELLSGQAAVALVSSQSFASIDRKLKTVQRVMDFIKKG